VRDPFSVVLLRLRPSFSASVTNSTRFPPGVRTLGIIVRECPVRPFVHPPALHGLTWRPGAVGDWNRAAGS
jgi:hypothetical protein